MKQITPNVYINISPQGRGCNYGFVVTSKGVVMIDTPMLPTNAIKLRDEIGQKGELRYVINTEYHPDHIAGNYFFSGTVVSHQGTREMFNAPIEQVVSAERARAAVDAGMGLREYMLWRYKVLDPEGLVLAPDYQLKLPTITFSERLTLYLGDHTFELIHFPGHTPYQVGVYIPQEKVLFTGDNFTNRWQPSLGNCSPLEWIESLKKIESSDVDFIVPGHGEVGDKIALREFIAFIQGAINTVRKAINQGISKEEAADTISFEGQLAACHPGSEQQRANVLRLYEMLLK